MRNDELTVREPGWIESLRNRVHGVFDRWLGRQDRTAPVRQESDRLPGWFGGLAFGPVVDVFDEDDEIRVVAELPGLTPEDFKVEVTPGRLILRGEKKASREESRDGMSISECSYGSFSRAIPLPAGVRTDGVEATFANGVLDLRLPKSEEAKARAIQVKVR